jgi:GMP synthase (glutamine-hydrolysing)
MRILVFQHHDVEHPGRLGATLRDHAFRLDIRRPDRGDPLPPDLDDVHAIIVMGGQPPVADAPAWLEREAELVRDAHQAELPVVGICSGAQMIARALGGEVGPLPTPVCALSDVALTVEAQTETIMSGIAWRHPQFIFQANQVTRLPPGATLLASTEHSRNQAFKVGLRTYAFQYHFELDRAMIAAFCREFKHLVDSAGANPDQIARQVDRTYDTYARLGSRLCVNLATYAFPFDRILAV